MSRDDRPGMGPRIELLADLERENGWVLVVDGSEQSYVDLADPLHLEFEYVEHIAAVITTALPAGVPLTALHLGGGLATIPRWIAERHPGSRQQIVEVSVRVAELCRRLPLPEGAELVLGDARAVLDTDPVSRVGLCVVDVYSGPDTVGAMFSLDALTRVARWLRPDGLLVANLSDAAPFDFARSAAASLRVVWESAVVVAEPAVLRGRRSGNVVLAASNGRIDLPALTRRCAGTLTRARVMDGDDLTGWIADAVPAADADGVPASGELDGLRF